MLIITLLSNLLELFFSKFNLFYIYSILNIFINITSKIYKSELRAIKSGKKIGRIKSTARIRRLGKYIIERRQNETSSYLSGPLPSKRRVHLLTQKICLGWLCLEV